MKLDLDELEKCSYTEFSTKNGVRFIVDSADAELVKKYSWRASRSKSGPEPKFYIRGYVGKKDIFLHRMLLNAPRHRLVDHINGNSLDNRRCNIRICSPRENAVNAHKKPSRHTKYRGLMRVVQKSGRVMWQVMIAKKYYGQYESEDLAAFQYDLKATELYGSFAVTNFPPDIIEYVKALAALGDE